jgi:hypothetical protein
MAFNQTDFGEIILPASVEILCENCFSGCRSLLSVTFESGPRFLGNEREVPSRAGRIIRDAHQPVEEVRKVSD